MTGPWSDALNRRRFLAWSLRAGIAALALPRLARASAAGTARCWRAMGTLVEVRVPDLPPAEAVEAVRAVRRRVEELEAAMTLFRAEGPLVALNRSRPGTWVPLPPGLREGLAAARDGARRYPGLYDPAVGLIMRRSGLQDLEPRPDDPGLRAWWRDRPGPDALELDAAGERARRLDPRVEWDLGGVGKGLAVDAALRELRAAGSAAALVNLGGSIGVLGVPPHEPGGWPVGIAHPRRPGELWGTFRLASGHVATSGDSERAVRTAAGRRHHLLDPRTGESTRGVASATVWAATGVDADLASTALAVDAASGGSAVRCPAVLLGDHTPVRATVRGAFPAVEPEPVAKEPAPVG